MTLDLTGEFLGLGSVVRLNDDNHSGLFVILARGGYRPDRDRNEVVPRYLVGPHPYGEAPDQETFPILASAIVEVVREGYLDEADAAFVDDLLNQMENGPRPIVRAQQFAGPLTELPEAQATENLAVDSNVSGDPFTSLREVVDRQQRKDDQ